METEALVTLVATILLALAGYLFAYFNGVRIDRRRARLDRINRQLSDLYGPLYALTQETEIAWRQFRAQHRKPDERFLHGDPPPTPEELADWRLWVTKVFMPANVQMEEAVVRHADLLVQEEMPQCLLQLVAHIGSYRALMKRWEDGETTEVEPLVAFPHDLGQYAERNYLSLKAEQRRLLGVVSS